MDEWPNERNMRGESMSFWSLVAVGVLVGVFFLYKDARRKQRAIRGEALRNYNAMKEIVLKWDQNRDDGHLTEMAIRATAIHRQRKQNCALMQLGANAVEIEYLNEYKLLMREEESDMGSPLFTSETQRYQCALSDLHMLSLG